LSRRVKSVLVVEMNAGQMVEDVRLGVGGRAPVHFFGRTGGNVPLPDEILQQIVTLAKRLDEQPAANGNGSGELFQIAGVPLPA
jgi:pyruvate/2-oxoacid:ferredoxin oxidoreductase alpha subunit